MDDANSPRRVLTTGEEAGRPRWLGARSPLAVSCHQARDPARDPAPSLRIWEPPGPRPPLVLSSDERLTPTSASPCHWHPPAPRTEPDPASSLFALQSPGVTRVDAHSSSGRGRTPPRAPGCFGGARRLSGGRGWRPLRSRFPGTSGSHSLAREVRWAVASPAPPDQLGVLHAVHTRLPPGTGKRP